ncbi:hypothetical protein E8E13_003297 [Curvularia kusanoi]|uniref:Uncharacterized protein n=1 Tax=Curvularia kusanoi TaxID=90978 RepID=A0A9P4W4V8_CURKU|nr:hypothetical protein E8E13_003297 [Curvularia kusanoi]
MPKWTPELDSILLQGVFEECNISFGKALCDKIAARVRAAGIEGFTECTPKAVENRLYSWKKKNTTVPGDADATVPSTPNKAAKTKKDATASRTPRTKKSAVKKVDSGAEEDEAETMSPTKGRKRAAKGENVGEVKKVKTEPAEQEDDGFGAGEMEEI